MRILIVHRYWWPDRAPAGTIFRAVAERWAADGHEVSVYSTQPDYNDAKLPRRARLETVSGVTVRRIALMPERKTAYLRRALNYLVFLAAATGHVLRMGKGDSGPYDMVVALTAPPIAPAALLGFAVRRRGGSLLYQCMDIYPEVSATPTGADADARFRILRWLDARNMRLATRTVVLSEDMAQLAADRSGGGAKVVTINNLDVDAYGDAEEPPTALATSDKCRFIFAGNLGRFQGLDTVVTAAHTLGPQSSVRFDFVGSGVAEPRLRDQAGALVGKTIHFHQPISPASAAAAIGRADVALVTLAPGVISAAYPSKTMTILRAGTPILAMVEADSELARMITDERLGAVVAPGDIHGFVQAVLMLQDEDLAAMGRRCRHVYDERFKREYLLDRWSDLAAEVESERTSR